MIEQFSGFHAYLSNGGDDVRSRWIRCSVLTEETLVVFVDDVECGWVALGANGEYYFVPPSKYSHAYPLEYRDNIAGTGSPSAEAATLAWLSMRKAD